MAGGLGGLSTHSVKAVDPSLHGELGYSRTPRMGSSRSGGGGGGRGGVLTSMSIKPPKKGKKGKGGSTVAGYQAPDVKKIATTAAPPKELTDYMKGYQGEVLGGARGRLKELREKGGAFMEEHRRQGRESVEARVEEGRQRAAEQGVPFDEAAAVREAMRSESGAAAEGLAGAEERIDRALAMQQGAYQGGLPVMQAPSQAAMQQKAQSLAEQQTLMDYWLGKESAATARASAATQEQAMWFDRLSSMLNTFYA